MSKPSDTPPAGVPPLPAADRKDAVQGEVNKALGGNMLPTPDQLAPRPPRKIAADVPKPRVGLLDGPDPLVAAGQAAARNLQTAFGNFVRTATGTIAAHKEYSPALALPEIAANVAIACDFNVEAADAFISDLAALLAKHGLA